MFAGEEKNTLLGAFAKDSLLLTELNHNFSSPLEDYQFVSFFKTRPMRKPDALTGLIKMVFVLPGMLNYPSNLGPDRR